MTVIAKCIIVKFFVDIVVSIDISYSQSKSRLVRFQRTRFRKKEIQLHNSIVYLCFYCLALASSDFVFNLGSISRIFVESDRAIKAQSLKVSVLHFSQRRRNLVIVFFSVRRIGCLCLLVSPLFVLFSSFPSGKSFDSSIDP